MQLQPHHRGLRQQPERHRSSSATGSSRTSSAPTAPTASSCATSPSSRAPTTTSTSSRPTASSSTTSSRAGRRTTGSSRFTSDNGLYDHIEAYGSRRLRRLPRLRARAPLQRTTASRSATSTPTATRSAPSGTAGNGTWTHDNDFHDNAAGIANDSFAPGHPGMPQDCSKWTDNEIHSNNVNLFEDANEALLHRHAVREAPQEGRLPGLPGRRRHRLHVLRRQRQHHRRATTSTTSTATASASSASRPRRAARRTRPSTTTPPTATAYTGNTSASGPDGTRDRNGLDVYWDEQGLRNCWQDNQTAPGVELTSDPADAARLRERRLDQPGRQHRQARRRTCRA